MTGVTVHARRVRAIHNRLVREQGEPPFKPQRAIIDELVLTVLSQHTSDVNAERAFIALKTRFPRWEDMLDAPLHHIAAAIRPGGLAKLKAPRLQAIMEEIAAREGRLSLDRLGDLDDRDVEEYLTSLPGVGPKTAACVLCFSMGRAAFPIDTHVHRIVRRLGWIPAETPATRAHRDLGPRIPAEIRYSLHMALIRHGRTVCTARTPRCSGCVLFDLCPSGADLVRAGVAV